MALPASFAKGGVIGALALLLAWVTPVFPLLCIAFFFVGLAGSLGTAPLIADISRWFVRRRGIAVSLLAGGHYGLGPYVA